MTKIKLHGWDELELKFESWWNFQIVILKLRNGNWIL